VSKHPFVIIFFIFSTLSFSQNLRVDYNAEFYGLDIDKNLKPNKEQQTGLDQVERMMRNAINSQTIVLYTKPNNQFLLEVEDKMTVDGQMSSNLGRSVLKLHTYLYGLDETTVLGYNVGEDFIVEYTNNVVEWTITSESKDILGFKCFKAVPKYLQSYKQKEISSYPNEVWFAPFINKRGGPYKFTNLPGLILGVTSSTATITAVKITEIKEDKIVPKIDKQIITEKQAYLNAKAVGAAIESRMRK